MHAEPAVTPATFATARWRVLPPDASKSMRHEGRHMRTATSSLLRFLGLSRPPGSPGWWAYFGSFGDDIFDDPEPSPATTS